MSQKTLNADSLSTERQSLSITGIAVTIIVSIGLGWGIFKWFTSLVNSSEAAVNPRVQEMQAFKNIQLIQYAQSRYKETDWDADGKKKFAEYIVHLWTTLDKNDQPVFAGFIPKKLAFAMEQSRSLGEYYFTDLHFRCAPGSSEATVPLDYEKEWGVLASPTGDAQNSRLYFFTHNSGVYAKYARYVQPQFIDDPVGAGWTKIDTVEELGRFQQTVTSNSN